MSDNRYNGWSNYETWAAKLHIDNEQGEYERWGERSRELLQAAIDADEQDPKAEAATSLADELESSCSENAPSLTGFYADVLNTALQAIDWREIAENMLSEFDVFAAGWNTPGCMPDNPPQLFIGSDDAREYIADEMDRIADEDDEELLQLTEELYAAAKKCRNNDGEYGRTIGGYHYFVNKV